MSEEQEKQDKILKVLQGGKSLNITKIASLSKISRSTASKYLAVLKSKGKVEEDDSEMPHKKFRLRKGAD